LLKQFTGGRRRIVLVGVAGMCNVVSCALGVNCQFKNVYECLLVLLKQFTGGRRRIVLVGVAAVIWSIWKAKNLACFQKSWPNDPSVILF
jgi:hypothetical protein